MPVAAIQSYTQAIANLPPEAFLGSLVFYTITQADVELKTAHDSIAALKLSTDGLRRSIRPTDAFAKAARECAHKFPTDGAVRSEVLVRPFGLDEDTVSQAMMLERFEQNKDGKKRRISYDKIAELTLVRGEREKGVYIGHGVEAVATEGVALSSEELSWLLNTLDGFSYHYHHHLTHLDSHAVRSFLRGYIDRLEGVCVRESGGMYFVKQEHSDEIGRLASWVQAIGSKFDEIGLLDIPKNRRMILAALEDEAVTEIERLMLEVAEILKSDRRIEPKTFNRYSVRAAELKEQLKDYSNRLGARAERADLEVSIFAQQLHKLLGRIAA